jgi:hypothetical protein
LSFRSPVASWRETLPKAGVSAGASPAGRTIPGSSNGQDMRQPCRCTFESCPWCHPRAHVAQLVRAPEGGAATPSFPRSEVRIFPWAPFVAVVALAFAACGPIKIPCRYTGGCVEPTPPPVETPVPTPATPTPTPAPTAAPTPCPSGQRMACSGQDENGVKFGCACEPEPKPPVPDVCPCAVIWSSTLFFSLDENHQVVPAPVAGGTVVIDPTLAFARWAGDGRGQPCNGEHDACDGRACDPITPPLWTMSPEIPECSNRWMSPEDAQRMCYMIDGHQLQIRRIARGHYEIHSGFPANLVDQGNPPHAITQCGWAPGPTRSDRVSFDVE